jgi:methionine sulfoxide reductase heme-binding subunit
VIAWDVARAAGLLAFACYTLAIAWGIGLAGRAWRPPAPQLDFHRFLSSLGFAALLTHIGALLADRFARVSIGSLIGADSRPAVTVGAAALWLALALPLSFRLKRAGWMSHRLWRSLHYTGYLVWALALVHGVAVGTDARSPVAVAFYAASAAIVGGAAWLRWLERPIAVTARPAVQEETRA